MPIDKTIVPLSLLQDIVEEIRSCKRRVASSIQRGEDDQENERYSGRALKQARLNGFSESEYIVKSMLEEYLNTEDSKTDQLVLAEEEVKMLTNDPIDKEDSCL